MENAWPIILIIIAIYYLVKITKVIPSGSCFAVVTLGQFKEFRGPGLHFKWSGGETTWQKLTTGERGIYVADGVAKFHELDLPVITKEKIEIGSFVKITSFTNEGMEISLDPNQTKSYICEKCGHNNLI